MLVITRRPKESIYIGDDKNIRIKILEVRGNQIQIGIDAPREVSIYREEIYEKMCQGKAAEEAA